MKTLDSYLEELCNSRPNIIWVDYSEAGCSRKRNRQVLVTVCELSDLMSDGEVMVFYFEEWENCQIVTVDAEENILHVGEWNPEHVAS